MKSNFFSKLNFIKSVQIKSNFELRLQVSIAVCEKSNPV